MPKRWAVVDVVLFTSSSHCNSIVKYKPFVVLSVHSHRDIELAMFITHTSAYA